MSCERSFHTLGVGHALISLLLDVLQMVAEDVRGSLTEGRDVLDERALLQRDLKTRWIQRQ